MMTDEQLCAPLVAICDELAAVMVEKRVVQPIATAQVQSGGSAYVSLKGDNFPDPGYKYFYGPGSLAAARAFIAALPDPTVRAVQNHMARVADCIDKGRAGGIDDAYIAPLVAVKAAMAENLLAAPVAS